MRSTKECFTQSADSHMLVQRNRLIALAVLCVLLIAPVDAQTEAGQEDSLVVESEQVAKSPIPLWNRIRSAGGGQRLSERILTKMFAGSVSSAVCSGALTGVLIKLENGGYENDQHEGPFFSAAPIFGIMYGTLIGFPLGVTLADPYDSFAHTLLVGYMLGLGGLATSRFLATNGFYVYPSVVLGALIASEKWRKPSQDRQVSFGLVPRSNGGLSAFAILRF